MIAEDDEAVRQALADLIGSEPTLELVGVADDAEAAIKLIGEHQPAIALLDVRMPLGGGARAAREGLKRAPGTRVLALSAYEDQASVSEMLELGAAGYIVKGMPDLEIVEAVHRAARGQFSMPAELATASFRALLRGFLERQEIEAILRQSQEKFHGLMEAAPDALVVVDEAGRIQLVNDKSEQLFGYNREELLARPIETLLPGRFRGAHSRHLKRYVKHPQTRPMGKGLALVGKHKDGSEFPVDISLSKLETDQGLLIVASVRDVTEQKLAEQELEMTFETLRRTGRERQALLAYLVRVQEEERSRIASDIHDDSIQAITAASLRLQQFRRRLSRSKPGELAMLDTLEDTIRLSIQRLRHLMFDLRPPALDRSGLAAALRESLEHMRAKTGTAFELEDGLGGEPSSESRVILFRIAQEALTNVRKHSKARTVRVQLLEIEGGCRVRIADDGVGFDAARAEHLPGHAGLTVMRERAEIAGGWWQMFSAPRSGTTVAFWVPLQLAAISQPLGGTAPLPDEELAGVHQ